MRLMTVLLIISSGAFLLSFPYKWWVRPRVEAWDDPQIAGKSMIGGLRDFRKRTGVWPPRLDALVQSRAFSAAGVPLVGESGRTMELNSYFYTYSVVDANSVSVWAIPFGDRAAFAQPHFFLIGVNKYRHWMGDSLGDDEMKLAVKLAQPTKAELERLRMFEVGDGGESGGGRSWRW
jgi:hypothetical protein